MRKKSVRPNQKQIKQPEARQYTVKEPMELLPFLLTIMPKAGRNSVKSILARAQVYVNNKVQTAFNLPLQAGQTIDIQTNKAAEKAPISGLTILHEDEDIIVINKDAGMLSIAAPKGDEMTVYRQLTDHVRNTDPKSRVFVVHRLDRDTSGIMMFAKNEKTKLSLQNHWQDAVKERIYIALVEGEVKKTEGTITSWLKESSTLKMYSSPHQITDSQQAITHYKVIQTSNSFSLLEVKLETGRKNQIRVHLQDIGHSVVGDKKYGAVSKAIGRLGLHARVLAFTHPSTDKLMRFETPTPKSFLSPFSSNKS